MDSFGGDDFGDETAGVVAVLVVEPAVVGGFEVVVQAAFGGECIGGRLATGGGVGVVVFFDVVDVAVPGGLVATGDGAVTVAGPDIGVEGG